MCKTISVKSIINEISEKDGVRRTQFKDDKNVKIK
jgi:hypothetical protein